MKGVFRCGEFCAGKREAGLGNSGRGGMGFAMGEFCDGSSRRANSRRMNIALGEMGKVRWGREFWASGRREFVRGQGNLGRLPNGWAMGSGAAVGEIRLGRGGG